MSSGWRCSDVYCRVTNWGDIMVTIYWDCPLFLPWEALLDVRRMSQTIFYLASWVIRPLWEHLHFPAPQGHRDASLGLPFCLKLSTSLLKDVTLVLVSDHAKGVFRLESISDNISQSTSSQSILPCRCDGPSVLMEPMTICKLRSFHTSGYNGLDPCLSSPTRSRHHHGCFSAYSLVPGERAKSTLRVCKRHNSQNVWSGWCKKKRAGQHHDGFGFVLELLFTRVLTGVLRCSKWISH